MSNGVDTKYWPYLCQKPYGQPVPEFSGEVSFLDNLKSPDIHEDDKSQFIGSWKRGSWNPKIPILKRVKSQNPNSKRGGIPESSFWSPIKGFRQLIDKSQFRITMKSNIPISHLISKIPISNGVNSQFFQLESPNSKLIFQDPIYGMQKVDNYKGSSNKTYDFHNPYSHPPTHPPPNSYGHKN